MSAARPLPAAYQSAAWVAKRLGVHPDTFRRNRPLLTRAGFPEPDPIMRRYLVDDVEAWIRKRRKVAGPGESLAGDETPEANDYAL